MRFTDSIIDSIGLFLVTMTLVGCLPPTQADLRPLVSACGAYSVMEVPDEPAPTPGVCKTCGGRGVLGDGVIKIPCPDCQKSKQQEKQKCQTGTCPTPRPATAR